jgi:PAS domain S-box-containing protein
MVRFFAQIITIKTGYQNENSLFINGVKMTFKLTYEELVQKTIDLEAIITAKNLLFSSIPTLIFELNEKGDYLNIWGNNPEAFAVKKEQLIGRNVSEVLPTDAAATIMKALKETKDYGQSQGQQIQLDTPKGKMWFELSTNLTPNTSSEPLKFIMLSHDITKHKLAGIKREETLSKTQNLRGIISICCYCHNIRNEVGNWDRIELYISQHSSADFSHGICPDCLPQAYMEAGIIK